jgi:1,2-phenylacetyl-CoA epoxidase catalytic subunit
MLSPKEFTAKIAQDCEPLYQHHEQAVKSYFDAKPSKEEMIGYFSRRMINERINCIQLAKRVASLPNNTSPEEMFLLSKQAHDEAKHFWYVKEIVEDMLGHEVDVDATYNEIKQAQLKEKTDGYDRFRPAELLEKFECSEDPLALAVYQYIAEGMAHRNWVMQAECAPNKLIAEKYAEIAKDEKFHSSIGRRKLMELCDDATAQQRILEVADEMRKDLFLITCAKSGMNTETKQMMEDAYGVLN